VSAEDVEAAKRGIEAYNRGEIERLVEMADPEVKMVPLRSLLEGGAYEGHDGVRRFMADMDEDWESREIEVDEVRDLGDSVLVLGNFHGLGHSGNEVRYPVAWHSEYRLGKLVKMTAYADQGSALGDLGLEA
jgi:ketosteroid isomerase-like protein